MVVNARGGDIRVPEPLLHFGDIGLMVERVGGGCEPVKPWHNHMDALEGAGKLASANRSERSVLVKPCV